MMAWYVFFLLGGSLKELEFEPFFVFVLLVLLAWLGVGLFLAVVGLSRGNLFGRLCAVIGIGLFLFLARAMWLSPLFTHVRSK